MMTARFRLPSACAATLMIGCSTPGSSTPNPAPSTTVGRTSSAGARAPEHRRGFPGPAKRPATRAAANVKHSHARAEAPQAVSMGGNVMTAPKVVPILFPGNPFDSQVRAFFANLAGSSYWSTATSEDGVGPVTVLPPFVPTFAAREDTATWLAQVLADPPPGLPAPDDETIYAIAYPPGWGADTGACVQYGADHWYTTMPSGQIAVYTENPMCPNGYLGLAGVEDATDAFSHEIIEAATDPTGQTYVTVNWALSGWASAGEGSAYAEVADLCEFQPEATYLDPQVGQYVQRIWSNAAAAAGHDPCLPHLPDRPVYFNAEVVLHDGTQVFPYGYAQGLTLYPGQEATVPVRLVADGPIGAWTLSADEEPNPHLSPDVYGELSFSWDEAQGKAGDVRHLTIRRSAPPDGGTAQVFLRAAITSTSGSIVNKSWLVVGIN